MENRIKEQQMFLFADRTSTSQMRSNQLRLWLSSIAYVLLQALRRIGLAGTPVATAQCQTIRLKLLKIGTWIRVTVRRCWVAFSSSYPWQAVFAQVLHNVRTYSPRRQDSRRGLYRTAWQSPHSRAVSEIDASCCAHLG
jgi:hypothetical protein